MTITHTEIELSNLLFYARHGVEAREKEAGNSFRVTLRVTPSRTDALVTDDVGATVSYADLYAIVRRVMTEGAPSDLLEHVACLILSELELSGLPISSAAVTITKVQPPIPGFIGDGASFTAAASFR